MKENQIPLQKSTLWGNQAYNHPIPLLLGRHCCQLVQLCDAVPCWMGGKVLLLPMDTKSFFFFFPAPVESGLPSGSVVKNLPLMQKLQETQIRSLGWEDSLEKDMATHSSTLAWRIPRTEKPGGLQSMG